MIKESMIVLLVVACVAYTNAFPADVPQEVKVAEVAAAVPAEDLETAEGRYGGYGGGYGGYGGGYGGYGGHHGGGYGGHHGGGGYHGGYGGYGGHHGGGYGHGGYGHFG